MPAKVQLPVMNAYPASIVSVPAAAGLQGTRAKGKGSAAPVETINSEAWFSVITELVPKLNYEGVQQALSILDRAIDTAHQAKVSGAGVEAQWQKQHQLLCELHQLQLASQLQASLCTPLLAAPPGLHEVPKTASKLPPAALGLKPSASAPGQNNARSEAKASAEKTRQQRNNTQKQPRQRLQPQPQPQIEQPAQDKLPPRKDVRQTQTLSTSLQLLSNEDPDCLFIVRRINKLGFKAARTLKKHFQQFGAVVRVLVAHSTVRQHGDTPCHARRRPSSLGFVQLSTAEAVAQVLTLGDEQDVEGSLIRVQRFERKLIEEQGEDDGDQAESTINSADINSMDWHRHMSSQSYASTSASSTTFSTNGSLSAISVPTCAPSGSGRSESSDSA